MLVHGDQLRDNKPNGTTAAPLWICEKEEKFDTGPSETQKSKAETVVSIKLKTNNCIKLFQQQPKMTKVSSSSSLGLRWNVNESNSNAVISTAKGRRVAAIACEISTSGIGKLTPRTWWRS